MYETAPYSPAGAEKGGTRPQRLERVSAKTLLAECCRFYAECYNSGELSSLVSGMEQLDEGASLTLTSHALQLAMLFLNDWVFAQEPKTVRDVVKFLTSERTLRILVASGTSWEEDRLALPEKSGRREFAAKVKATFLSTEEAAFLNRLGMVLRLNLDLSERWLVWKEISSPGPNGLFTGLICWALSRSRRRKTTRINKYLWR